MFHFHFCQFLLFPLPCRLALENSAFELQRIRVRLTSKQGEKENHQKTFKKIFLPICPSTSSSQVVPLYSTPPKTYILGQTLTEQGLFKAKLNCEVLHSELLFCKGFFLIISLAAELTLPGFLNIHFVLLCHSLSQPLGQAGQTCWGWRNIHPVWFVATPYKEMELPPASPSAETSPLLRHNCSRKQTETQ